MHDLATLFPDGYPPHTPDLSQPFQSLPYSSHDFNHTSIYIGGHPSHDHTNLVNPMVDHTISMNQNVLGSLDFNTNVLSSLGF